MKELAKRFKEPSSWAGIATMLALLAPQLHLTEETVHLVIQVGSAIAGVLAVALPESKE